MKDSHGQCGGPPSQPSNNTAAHGTSSNNTAPRPESNHEVPCNTGGRAAVTDPSKLDHPHWNDLQEIGSQFEGVLPSQGTPSTCPYHKAILETSQVQEFSAQRVDSRSSYLNENLAEQYALRPPNPGSLSTRKDCTCLAIDGDTLL